MWIAIYPGHVGKDSGAIDASAAGDDLYTLECQINGQVASKVFLLCTLLGWKPIIALGDFDARIKATSQCDIGVSIHADACTNQSVRGFHAMYCTGSTAGESIAKLIDESLRVIIPRARSAHARSDLIILKRTTFPVVLVECGFLTNDGDEKLLHSEFHQYHLAWGIVEGLRRWVGA